MKEAVNQLAFAAIRKNWAVPVDFLPHCCFFKDQMVKWVPDPQDHKMQTAGRILLNAPVN